jgi:hypothetical protein
MQKILFALFVLLFALFSCKNDTNTEAAPKGPVSEMVNNPATIDLPTDTNQLARIRFEENTFDFGTVEEGAVVEHAFKFTNVGSVPLTILKCRSSCGCTVPDWPTEPIPPGGTGEIKAKFNTEGKTNLQQKAITVTANTHPNDTKVMLKGQVNPE